MFPPLSPIWPAERLPPDRTYFNNAKPRSSSIVLQADRTATPVPIRSGRLIWLLGGVAAFDDDEFHLADAIGFAEG